MLDSCAPNRRTAAHARRERKAYLVNLPASASLRELVHLARARWPIEQHYRELKDDLGVDHFDGRSYRAGTIMR